jgi:sugar phosphate isomerase/epimerase
VLIGAMNHPKRDLTEEIRWMAELGLDFIDLTIEPPSAASWQIDPKRVREEIEAASLKVVGHTAYYLPIESPFEEIRQAAVRELIRCAELFRAIGAEWMNIHPGRYTPLHARAYFIERDLLSLREICAACCPTGIGIMVENIPGDFNTVEELGDLLDPMPELGLHLDIGHSNLDVPENTADALIQCYGKRIKHVHLHDNKGGHVDMHLPLGAGTMDWRRHVRQLRDSGYDDTITLEVFSDDHRYLAYSRDLLRAEWDSLSTPREPPTPTPLL